MAKKKPGPKPGTGGRPPRDPQKLTADMLGVLAALIECRWYITEALQKCQVPYSTFMKWRKTHPGFAEAYEALLEQRLDLVEDELRKEVEKGNIAAICFFLKCQGKHRGWVERVEHTGRAGQPIEYQIIDRFEVKELQDTSGAAGNKDEETES